MSSWCSSRSVDWIWSFGAGCRYNCIQSLHCFLNANPNCILISPSYLHRFYMPSDFSSCSRDSYDKFLEDKLSNCLFNTPLPTDIISIPICGNQVVEMGEDCDCGTIEVLPFLKWSSSLIAEKINYKRIYGPP
jgi:hypothetical protein